MILSDDQINVNMERGQLAYIAGSIVIKFFEVDIKQFNGMNWTDNSFLVILKYRPSRRYHAKLTRRTLAIYFTLLTLAHRLKDECKTSRRQCKIYFIVEINEVNEQNEQTR